MLATIATWFKGLAPIAKAAYSFGIVLAILVLLGAPVFVGYHWGRASMSNEVARKTIEAKDATLLLIAAEFKELARREDAIFRREKEIENDRIKVKIVRVPGECRLTDESYGLFIEQIRDARADSGIETLSLPSSLSGDSTGSRERD